MSLVAQDIVAVEVVFEVEVFEVEVSDVEVFEAEVLVDSIEVLLSVLVTLLYSDASNNRGISYPGN